MQLNPYKLDPNSFHAYFGGIRAGRIMYQRTEANAGLLDLEFEVPQKDGEVSKLLLRFETSQDAILDFLKKLVAAWERPAPHPSMDDMFIEAVTGLNLRNPFGSGASQNKGKR